MVIFCKRSSVDTVFAEVTVKAPILAAFIKGASYTPYICIYIYIYIYMEIKFYAACFIDATYAQVRPILQQIRYSCSHLESF